MQAHYQAGKADIRFQGLQTEAQTTRKTLITKQIKKASNTKARQVNKKLGVKRIEKKGHGLVRPQGLNRESTLNVWQSQAFNIEEFSCGQNGNGALLSEMQAAQEMTDYDSESVCTVFSEQI